MSRHDAKSRSRPDRSSRGAAASRGAVVAAVVAAVLQVATAAAQVEGPARVVGEPDGSATGSQGLTESLFLEAASGYIAARDRCLSFQRDKADVVVADCTRALERMPSFLLRPLTDRERARAHLRRGVAYRASGRLREAGADFDASIELAPDEPDGYRERAALFGDPLDMPSAERAFADLKRVTELVPDSVAAFRNLAVSEVFLGPRGFDAAAADAERALALHDTAAAARAELSATFPGLVGTDANDDAHGRSSRPTRADLLTVLGAIRLAQEDHPAALQAFRAAIDEDRHNGDAHAGAALALSASADVAETERMLSEAARLMPRRPDVRVWRAAIRLDTGRTVEGLSDLFDALVLFEHTDRSAARAGAYMFRAIAFLGVGLAGEAHADCLRAIRLNFDQDFGYCRRDAELHPWRAGEAEAFLKQVRPYFIMSLPRII